MGSLILSNRAREQSSVNGPQADPRVPATFPTPGSWIGLHGLLVSLADLGTMGSAAEDMVLKQGEG